MHMTQFTKFEKSVKKRLVDIDQTQDWLINRVQEKTGMFFNGSYLYKIMAGKRNAPVLVSAICGILNIERSPIIPHYLSNKQDNT